ncbi:Transient receptor putative cation channel sub M member 3, partial [Bulinus truncatus]
MFGKKKRKQTGEEPPPAPSTESAYYVILTKEDALEKSIKENETANSSSSENSENKPTSASKLIVRLIGGDVDELRKQDNNHFVRSFLKLLMELVIEKKCTIFFNGSKTELPIIEEYIVNRKPLLIKEEDAAKIKEFLLYAIKTEGYNFIKHLIEQGLKLQKYIKPEEIQNQPTHYAMYAIEIMNQMRLLIYPDDQDHDINVYIQIFEELAIETVKNTFDAGKNDIYKLLTYEDENLRNTNCIVLAMKNNCGKFLSQLPCRIFNDTIWRNGKLPKECILARNPLRRRRKFSSIFDRTELVALILFILTWILRIVSYVYQEYILIMVWTRVFFSIDYIMFCIYTLKFCCTSRYLGPKLIMIIEMFKTLLQFLLIVLAFFAAFTVASQAVLYPKSEMSFSLVFHIMKRPFWAVFGDFALSDIDVDVAECSNDPDVYNKYTQLRCPTESGSYYVPALMGAYVVIVNSLLFNLLIALFNSYRSTNKIGELSEEKRMEMLKNIHQIHNIIFSENNGVLSRLGTIETIAMNILYDMPTEPNGRSLYLFICKTYYIFSEKNGVSSRLENIETIAENLFRDMPTEPNEERRMEMLRNIQEIHNIIIRENNGVLSRLGTIETIAMNILIDMPTEPNEQRILEIERNIQEIHNIMTAVNIE